MNSLKSLCLKYIVTLCLLVNAFAFDYASLQEQDENLLAACPQYITIYTNGPVPGTTTIYPTSNVASNTSENYPYTGSKSLSSSSILSNSTIPTSSSTPITASVPTSSSILSNSTIPSSSSISASTITTTIISGSTQFTTTFVDQSIDTVEVVIPTAGYITTTLTSGSSYPVSTTTLQTASGTQSGLVEVITPSCGCSPENSFHLRLVGDSINPSYVYKNTNVSDPDEGNMYTSTEGNTEAVNVFYYDPTAERILTCDCVRPVYTIYTDDPDSSFDIIKNNNGTFTFVESSSGEIQTLHVSQYGALWITSPEYDGETGGMDDVGFRADDVTLVAY